MALRILFTAIFLFSIRLFANDPAKLNTYITTIDNFNLAFGKSVIKPQSLFKSDQYLAFKATDAQLEVFSQTIHAQKNTCGGFTLEEDSINQTLTDLQPKKLNQLSKKDLIIDQQKIVTQIIEFLSKDRFAETITSLANFPDRFSQSQTGADAAAWIKNFADKNRSTFNRPDVEIFYVDTPRYKQKSVVIKVPGTSNQEAVVIGGHMDTLRGQMPGADDDASGTASVLEVFSALLQSKIKLKNDVYFILYAAEELGLVGSKYVVSHFTKTKINVKASMQLDMTGYHPQGAQGPIYFVTDNTDSELTSFTQQLAIRYLGKTQKQIKTLKCGYACSDHARWHRAGVPAVFPFESAFENHNPHIHTGRDKMELVNIDHAYQYVQLAAAFIGELAN